jgi:hypothetical protein
MRVAIISPSPTKSAANKQTNKQTDFPQEVLNSLSIPPVLFAASPVLCGYQNPPPAHPGYQTGYNFACPARVGKKKPPSKI